METCFISSQITIEQYVATERMKYRPISAEVEICPKHIVKGRKIHRILRT